MALRIRKVKQQQKALLILNSNTDFSVVEAYKTIRTNLMFALHNHGSRSLIITSASPGEGKSTNCCNLGITLAQTSFKVLIIDCDLRKPVIHKLFWRKCIPGLSELLAGMNDYSSDVIQSTDYPNLDIICGGTIPPNPAELLSSDAMRNLLFILYQEYDFILLDSPPVNLVADALALSVLTDGVIIVVKQGQTTHPELAHALSSLKFANANVLGIIINEVKTGSRSGYLKNKYMKYNDYYCKHK